MCHASVWQASAAGECKVARRKSLMFSAPQWLKNAGKCEAKQERDQRRKRITNKSLQKYSSHMLSI
jgi:DNA topoisomerase IB